jgi:hypothetical protein
MADSIWNYGIGAGLGEAVGKHFVHGLPKFDFSNPGPQRVLDFLQREEAPGGYLAPGQTSLENAQRVRGIYANGRQSYIDSLFQLGASGISRRYAQPIAQRYLDDANASANDTMATAMGTGTERRFDAMTGYINARNQSEWASKEAEINYGVAKMGAQASVQGGATSHYGNIAGSVMGMFKFSDRRMKKNVERVGVEGGLPIYEFEYRGKLGKENPGRFRGVMADEVEPLIPSAVKHDKRGRAMVDYAQLGTKMSRVA